MSRRRQAAGAIVASPVLVGAVTVLVAIVAVFIAYGANAGLPFVPTYDLKVELPSGAKLVKGNEVRVGGFRVGVVEQIGATRRVTGTTGEDEETVALVDLKLDKPIEPLAKDTSFTVRPRSALGLKYIEVVPGRSKQLLAAGATVPVGNAGVDAEPPTELEDVLATFDTETREASKTGLEGFGSGLAGRGQSINQAVRELNPLLRSLRPVMRNLNDPDTELEGFFQGLGRAAGEAAPVASTQAALFANMADTFAAMTRSPAALQDSISEGVPTQIQSIHSFRFQQPFLRDFADLSRRLRPAAEELPRSLPPINRALLVGRVQLPRTVSFSNRLRDVFNALDDLGENPNTLLAIRDLDVAVRAGRPGLDFVAPYQTVCNHAIYFLNPLGTHISQEVGGGTLQRVQIKFANFMQVNALTARSAARPVDVSQGQDNKQPGPNPPAALHVNPDSPAVDASGNADCENGQTGYTNRYYRDPRYRPNELGGRQTVLSRDLPGLRGGTWKARELGIDHVEDVP
jgi:ABC-type transporter Mla subunit MlaD